ncbi:MAG: serine hydrolase [Pseudomonadota bacterium]
MKLLAKIIVVVMLAGIAVWAWIGPDWRRLLSNLPTANDVLFWTQAERSAGFRMGDKLTFIVSSRDIPNGDNVRDLPIGEPLDLDVDIDAFMEANNTAAVIVLHNGEVLLERYGLEFTREGRWTSFSVAKSFTSTLVGAAIRDGHIGSLNDTVSTYVPGLRGSAYDEVTIEQLLTMTSGVAWNENYSDPASDVANFINAEPEEGEASIVTYLKRLPRAHPPGEVYNYSTGETNLVGILVAEAVGQPLADYLSEKIWVPFGMEQKATWLLGSTDEELSGCCIQMATRDLARFGQFMLEGGVAGGSEVLPDGWIETATSNLVGETDRDRGYGYQWWTLPGDETPMANGIFGQGMLVDFERNLIIATNSNWQTSRGIEHGEYDRQIEFYRAVQRAVE